MFKIITALGSPYLNKRLENENDFEIITKDIQYQDGIFEILEKNKEINFLILSEILLGKYNIEKLVEKIKEKNNDINVIVIMEDQKEEIEKNLYLKGVKKIYYNNNVNEEKIIDFIRNENNKSEDYEKLKEELQNLKEILLKNNIKFDNLKNSDKEKYKKDKKKTNKVVAISGTGGIGKSIVTLNLTNILKEKNQKILILDFDILNNSLHTVLGVNQYSKKIKEKLDNNQLVKSQISIKDLIIKINKKVDLISGINLLFDSDYKISSEKIKFILNELKEYYDVIIIDTSSECFFDYTKNIFKNSDLILFLLEANLLEIKKSNNLLKIYKDQWNIQKEKINIIINKYNENSIDEEVIKKIFSEYKVLGKIKFDKKYNLLINKNFEEDIYTKNVKRDYEKISEKIIKLNNNKWNLKFENLFNRFIYNLYQKN